MGDGNRPFRERDLDDRVEIEELVRRFYRDVAQDPTFARYFDALAHVDWQVHTGAMTDFWSAVLLADDRPMAADDVIERHRWLHEADAFDVALFESWLALFEVTLDGGWRGPYTERARHRARGLAWAMSRRLVGATGALREGGLPSPVRLRA